MKFVINWSIITKYTYTFRTRCTDPSAIFYRHLTFKLLKSLMGILRYLFKLIKYIFFLRWMLVLYITNRSDYWTSYWYWLGLWVLTPLLMIFIKLYRGGQFYWWRTPDYSHRFYQALYKLVKNVRYTICMSTLFSTYVINHF